jgi:hypothetical protein
MVEGSRGATRQTGSVGMRSMKNAGPTDRKDGCQGNSGETKQPICLEPAAANDSKLYRAPKVEGAAAKVIHLGGRRPFRS